MDSNEINKELGDIYANHKNGADFKNPLQQVINKITQVFNQDDPFWEFAAEGVLYAAALSLLMERDCKASSFTIAEIKNRAIGSKDYNDIKKILQMRLEKF
jgi:hypothetical protein